MYGFKNWPCTLKISIFWGSLFEYKFLLNHTWHTIKFHIDLFTNVHRGLFHTRRPCTQFKAILHIMQQAITIYIHYLSQVWLREEQSVLQQQWLGLQSWRGASAAAFAGLVEPMKITSLIFSIFITSCKR